MSFNDVFKSGFLENIAEFSVVDMLIGLAVSLVIGMFIFAIYKKTLTGIMYSEGFALTLVGLSLVTTLVIMAVTSNVVLSLGMVGALSVDRSLPRSDQRADRDRLFVPGDRLRNRRSRQKRRFSTARALRRFWSHCCSRCASAAVSAEYKRRRLKS